MAKKSVEELDEELARLEAELAALESGAAPEKPKKKAKPAAPPEPEASEPAAPKAARKLPFKRKAAPPPEPAAPAEAPPEPKPARKLGLGKLGRRGRASEPAAPEEEASAPAPEPAPPPPPSTGWQQVGGAWRASAAGPSKVEVVRREVDQRGQVTREETIGEETEELPPPAPEPEAPRGLFGRRRKAESPPEDEPAPPAELAPPGEERPKRRRRGWILIPVLIILALLLLAVVLPALGVDPLGVGDRLGVGGGNPPEARFTLSGNVAAVGQLVTFDASGSRDPAGGALEYAWDFGDGSGASSARATHAYTARSTQEGYTVTLTVRAAGGKEAQHTEHVVVVPPPQARIAIQVAGAAVSAPYQTLAGQELAFDGGGSTAEGGVRTYSWSFGDGAPTQTGAHVTHTYTRVGGFRATLTVADTNGLLGNTSALVYVGEGRVVASQAPASVDGAKSVNETLAVFAGGGAAPYRPQSLTVTLAYNATTPAPPLPLPLPGGVNPDELTVRVYDATGAVVGQGIGPGAVVQVTDFGAVGAWTIEVFRPQGGAQALPYELGIELRNGPA